MEPLYPFVEAGLAVLWANEETRAQAGPQLPPDGSVFYPYLPVNPQLVTYNITELISPERRSKRMGYIESKVTIDGVGVPRRVLCYNQAGDLIAETRSGADGTYRFDNLLLTQRYMLIAQDDPVFGAADYNAVAADWQAPSAYSYE